MMKASAVMFELAWFAIGVLTAVVLDALLAHLIDPARRADPKTRMVDVEVALAVLAGLGSGALLAWVAPVSALPKEPFRGLGRVLLPLALGAALHYWGGLLKRKGRTSSTIATWYGGGIFGMSLAIGRLVLRA